MSSHTFTAGFLFAGLGAGALGFIQAASTLGKDGAKFVSLGGIDNDPLACKDFEYLTNSPSLCADLSKLTIEEILAFFGLVAPDCVFLSPPCKGFSGLLSAAMAALPQYQDLNKLVLQGLFLLMSAWKTPPALIVIENVPRIQSRGKELLTQAKAVLSQYGYVFSEATHDCGEIGGLAQHRRRYLLVARLKKKVPNFIYQPPTKRVRGCGEVLGLLPLPEEPSAGELHKLPEISWLNWVRLALIPAGGDWRDLPQQEAISLKETAKNADSFGGRPGLMGVGEWDQPAPTVTGKMAVSSGNGQAAIADPRPYGFKCNYGVAKWEEPLGTVTGAAKTSSGTFSVADPRLCSPLEPGQEKRAVWAKYTVRKWEEPVGAVTGPGSNGEFGVADVRLQCQPRSGSYGVLSWQEAAGTITGAACHDNGSFSIADPRKAPEKYPVIIAADNTWHRPLTTLELAALQGLPSMVNGKPLALAGRSSAKWRERIGNAVPVGAATAIAESLLTALLAASLKTWTLGSTGIWVQKRSRKAKKAKAKPLIQAEAR